MKKAGASSWVQTLVWSVMSVTLVFFVISAYGYKRTLHRNEALLQTLRAEQKTLQERAPSIFAQERALEAQLRERRSAVSR